MKSKVSRTWRELIEQMLRLRLNPSALGLLAFGISLIVGAKLSWAQEVIIQPPSYSTPPTYSDPRYQGSPQYQAAPPAVTNPSIQGQPSTQAQPSVQGTERSALKPSIPSPTPSLSKPATLGTKSSERKTGLTYVSLEPGLDSILKGNEPKNKAELVALQKQQSKIAEKINLVTVNLQHGSTQGSGVIITAEGYILTAAHVAGRPNQKINIIMHDGTRIEGVAMGVNRFMDAGLVRITKPVRDTTTNPWPHATLGVSSELQRGEWVLATGHPGGWMADRPAVLRVGRLLKTMPSTMITDCALIGGDSGGPLFNLKGELVGIHSRIGVDVDDNMHVPVDVFADSWTRLVKNEAWGTLPGFKPAIGVRGVTGADGNDVCRIARVDSGGPADKAGVLAGDVITRFDGVPIRTFDELKSTVDSLSPGEQVTVEILRDGKRIERRLIVGVRE